MIFDYVNFLLVASLRPDCDAVLLVLAVGTVHLAVALEGGRDAVAGGEAPEVVLSASANTPRFVRLVHAVAVAVAYPAGVHDAQIGAAQSAVLRLVHVGGTVDFAVAEALLWNAAAVTARQPMRTTH